MNKTYTMDKEVRNSFKRILKDIEYNAELKWSENSDDTHSHFSVECSENVIQLIDKYIPRLEMVNLIIRAKSKFKADLEEITHSLNGKIAQGSKKGYFIITLERAHRTTFKNYVEQRGLDISISQSMF